MSDDELIALLRADLAAARALLREATADIPWGNLRRRIDKFLEEAR